MGKQFLKLIYIYAFYTDFREPPRLTQTLYTKIAFLVCYVWSICEGTVRDIKIILMDSFRKFATGFPTTQKLNPNFIPPLN